MLTKFIKIGNLIWKAKNARRHRILFSASNKNSSKNNFLILWTQNASEKQNMFLKWKLLVLRLILRKWKFLLIILSYLIKKGKMNHKISCMPSLHERNEQKSHVAISRGSPLLWFSRWSPALQRLDVIRWKSLETERDTNRDWGGGEESASLAEKLVKSIFFFLVCCLRINIFLNKQNI